MGTYMSLPEGALEENGQRRSNNNNEDNEIAMWHDDDDYDNEQDANVVVVAAPSSSEKADSKRAAVVDAATESSSHKKPKFQESKEDDDDDDTLPFDGNEIVPLASLLEGSWVVVYDEIVDGTDHCGLEVESQGRSHKCRIEFSATGAATIDKGESDGHLEGALEAQSTLDLPSGRQVLCFNWSPPPGKTSGPDSCMGYSDVCDFMQGDKEGTSPSGLAVDVTVEGSTNKNKWEGMFPLSGALFGDQQEKGKEQRKRLPPDGVIAIVHWHGCDVGPGAEFGVKEFLYLCRPDSAEAAISVLKECGALNLPMR